MRELEELWSEEFKLQFYYNTLYTINQTQLQYCITLLIQSYFSLFTLSILLHCIISTS